MYPECIILSGIPSVYVTEDDTGQQAAGVEEVFGSSSSSVLLLFLNINLGLFNKYTFNSLETDNVC